MKIRNIIAVPLLAVAALVPAASANSATTGDIIVNMAASNGKLVVKDGSVSWDLLPGRLSTNWGRDMDFFWVPGGCDATSQWGYRYVGDKWYGPLPGNAYLKLTVDC